MPNDVPPHDCTAVCLLTHQPVGIWVSTWAVMDDAVVNVTVVLCGCMLPFLLGKYLGVELLDPVITLFFVS